MPYELEKYRGPASRHTCPHCEKPRSFALYICTETRQPVHANVGRCNREQRCGYHRPPAEHFRENGLPLPAGNFRPIPPPPRKRSFFAEEHFVQTLGAYDENHLITFLLTHFPALVVQRLVDEYFLGTVHSPWPGSTVFWQVDGAGRVRAGKVMQYDHQTGKRVKKPESRVVWMHTVLKLKDFHLDQVLFGAHLLPLHPDKPVGVVESEKTAIICAACYPERVWLATGGLQMLSPERCRILAGRQVEFFPDAGCYSLWWEKINTLTMPGNFVLSALLEEVATPGEREAGFDLADYLLRYSYTDFVADPVVDQPTAEEPRPDLLPEEPEPFPAKVADINERRPAPEPAAQHLPGPTPAPWNVAGLEAFFASAQLPDTLRLDECTVVINPRQFIDCHLEVIKANNGTRLALPYFQRLERFKDLLKP